MNPIARWTLEPAALIQAASFAVASDLESIELLVPVVGFEDEEQLPVPVDDWIDLFKLRDEFFPLDFFRLLELILESLLKSCLNSC